MPELPEVETYVREIAPHLQGRQVTAARVRWARTIESPDPTTFAERILGPRFAAFSRRGKYMLLGMESGDTLIVHLRTRLPQVSESESTGSVCCSPTRYPFRMYSCFRKCVRNNPPLQKQKKQKKNKCKDPFKCHPELVSFDKLRMTSSGRQVFRLSSSLY